MLNHFFVLFSFSLPGCGARLAGAALKLEDVSWEGGLEKPAKETGPEGEGSPNVFCGNTG